jgi:hypothetical protein
VGVNEMKLVVYHPVPSLNKLFGMNHWQRQKEKKATQAAFRSALLALGDGYSIKTTLWENSPSTAAGMLALFDKTLQTQSAMKSARSKLRREKKNAQKSK